MPTESRSRKSMKNLAFSLLMQLSYVVSSFVTRTVLVKTLGVETAGLNSLFTEIIAVLSLTELGVGSAITFHLYKPLADDDRPKLVQLMTLYRRAYRVIAGATLALGLALMPLLPWLIKDVSIPMDYINKVYALFVVQTASTYLLSYKSALIDADQKHYIVAVVGAVTRLAACALCVLALVVTREFLWYLGVSIVLNFAGNLALSRVADKRYPFLKESAEIAPEERKKVFANVRNVFVSKASGRVTNSTDNILISAMVSTTMVGYYGYYSMVFSAARGMLSQFATAATGSVGNLMATESPQKCEETLLRMTYVFFLITSVCVTVLYCALEPLLTVWLGREFVLGGAVLLCCVVNEYLSLVRSPLFSLLDASGLFKENRNISLAASGVNLVVSVALAPSLGVVGILLGTTCTHLIQLALKTRLLFKKRLCLPARGYALRMALMAALLAAELFCARFLCSLFSLPSTVLYMLACAGIGVAVSALLGFVCTLKFPEYRYTRWLVRSTARRFLKK